METIRQQAYRIRKERQRQRNNVDTTIPEEDYHKITHSVDGYRNWCGCWIRYDSPTNVDNPCPKCGATKLAQVEASTIINTDANTITIDEPYSILSSNYVVIESTATTPAKKPTKQLSGPAKAKAHRQAIIDRKNKTYQRQQSRKRNW